jgi:hypothetical protein
MEIHDEKTNRAAVESQEAWIPTHYMLRIMSLSVPPVEMLML